MQQRDYLLDQIEQLTKALTKIIGYFLNKTITQEQLIQHVDEHTSSLLNLPIERIKDMKAVELLNHLDKHNFQDSHKHQFIELLGRLEALGDQNTEKYKTLKEEFKTLISVDNSFYNFD